MADFNRTEQAAEVFNIKRKPKGEIKFNIHLNEEQKRAKSIIIDNEIVVVTGPAGTGKTMVVAQTVLDLIFRGEVDKIFITRPTQQVGSSLGFLPGNLSEKLDPYLDPFKDNLYGCYDRTKIDTMIKEERIEGTALQFIRGRTYGQGKVLVVDECLHGSTLLRIRLDGVKEKKVNFRKLIWYFNNNKKVDVLSFNHETDTIEYKEVLNLQLGRTQKWIELTDHLKTTTVCTENHPVCTLNYEGLIEYVDAKDLKVGDSYIKYQHKDTVKHNIINYNNLDILCGLLLGDGSLSRNEQTQDCARISKNHGLEQRDYMLFCMSLFDNAKESKVRSGFTGEYICGFTSKSYNVPKKVRDSLYRNPKNKQVSIEIGDYLTNRSLALWYMDDGSLGASNRITLHTEGFNKESVRVLIAILKEKFNVDSEMFSYKKKHKVSESYYHRIIINKENSRIFFNLIRGLIHPNLKYKIPSDYWEEFKDDEYRKFKNINSIYTGMINNIKEIPLSDCEITYNMEVEGNNNYFAGNTLVHNCQNTTKAEMLAILTRLGKGGRIILIGDVSQKDIVDHFDGLSYVVNMSKMIKEIQLIKLKENHRSDLVAKILEYEYR
jgi:hypothetical protein